MSKSVDLFIANDRGQYLLVKEEKAPVNVDEKKLDTM